MYDKTQYLYKTQCDYHGAEITQTTGGRPARSTIIPRFALLGVWRQTLQHGGIGGELDECAVSTPASTDAVAGSRAPDGRVAVGVARPTDRRVVAVFHRRTSRHACADGNEVTTFLTLVRALSQPISNDISK